MCSVFEYVCVLFFSLLQQLAVWALCERTQCSQQYFAQTLCHPHPELSEGDWGRYTQCFHSVSSQPQQAWPRASKSEAVSKNHSDSLFLFDLPKRLNHSLDEAF